MRSVRCKCGREYDLTVGQSPRFLRCGRCDAFIDLRGVALVDHVARSAGVAPPMSIQYAATPPARTRNRVIAGGIVALLLGFFAIAGSRGPAERPNSMRGAATSTARIAASGAEPAREGEREATPLCRPDRAQPATGILSRTRRIGGHGVLNIINGNLDDAIVVVASRSGGDAAGRLYVRAGDRARLVGVAPGVYTVRFVTGVGYVSALGAFCSPGSAQEFDDPLRFTESEASDGTEGFYREMTVTLHRTPQGNASAHEIPVSLIKGPLIPQTTFLDPGTVPR